MENCILDSNDFNQTSYIKLPMDKEQQWLKPAEVAKQLGVSERTVHRLIEYGKLRAYKIGRSVKFRPEDVEEYLQNSQINPKITSE